MHVISYLVSDIGAGDLFKFEAADAVLVADKNRLDVKCIVNKNEQKRKRSYKLT